MLYEKELHFARSVAMHAGELALGHQVRGLQPESKADLTPVTIADRECEQLIASRIEAAFPDDGILGEEGSSKASRNGRRWIIDPIDGTKDFIRGLPLWATLIGFEVDGTVVAGVAGMPARQEQYSAIAGGGAWRNDHRIAISNITSPASAVACINGVNRVRELPFAADFLEWSSQFWAVRSFGGCLDAVLLASGFVDLWIEPYAQAWDLAPLKIIFDEVGVRFCNFDGGSSIYGGNGIAFVPALEPAVRSLLGSAARA
ncbi:MAG TPA: inositol monophosphatase family protein [Bryobacteraceae bacterium]|nr:inositol monophosphatase family protein [Bryobacteraceae bacterium]